MILRVLVQFFDSRITRYVKTKGGPLNFIVDAFLPIQCFVSQVARRLSAMIGSHKIMEFNDLNDISVNAPQQVWTRYPPGAFYPAG